MRSLGSFQKQLSFGNWRELTGKEFYVFQGLILIRHKTWWLNFNVRHPRCVFPIYIYIYIYIYIHIYILLWRCDPTRVMASSFLRFLDHTQRRNTVGRTPLDEWSARRRVPYMTTHHTHNRQTSMPPVGFEPTISEGERPQTYVLDRAATGTGITNI